MTVKKQKDTVPDAKTFGLSENEVRIASRFEGCQVAGTLAKYPYLRNNRSGYRNVCWEKKSKRWIVQLQVNGKNTVLKKFKENELEEAGKYAEKMRKELYGKFAGGN